MRRSHIRTGAALVVTLVTLAVIVLLSAAVLRSLVAARRQSLQSLKALQAGWLAESALERAAACLVANPDYRGETWEVEFARDGEHPAAAVVTIEVPTATADGRQVRAAAHFDGLTVLRTRSLSRD